jgi:hypothetical protein
VARKNFFAALKIIAPTNLVGDAGSAESLETKHLKSGAISFTLPEKPPVRARFSGI